MPRCSDGEQKRLDRPEQFTLEKKKKSQSQDFDNLSRHEEEREILTAMKVELESGLLVGFICD